MAEQLANNATGLLASTITDTAVSLSLGSGEGAAFPASGVFRIVIGSEIIRVGARSGDTLSSLTRGQEGTTAAVHMAGAEVAHVLTAGGLAAVVADAIAAIPPAAGLPSGAMVMHGATSAPTGYLLCDGSAVSRSTYSDLFAAIGTTWGAGNGSTTFNVPDMRGRAPFGYAASGGHSDVSALANADSVTLANRRPKHKHTVTDPGHVHSVPNIATSGGASVSDGFGYGSPRNLAANSSSATTGITVGTSTDQADAPAYLVVNFIIKT